MKRRFPLALAAVVFLVGLSILLYPVISQMINARSQTMAVASYVEEVARLEEKDCQSMLLQAEQYNRDLAARGYAYSGPTADFEKVLLAGESGAIGYIEIPKIDISLPIYQGTGHAVLQIGVGHLEGTSLPVGGQDTHTVLSGHRGLPSSKLLTDLDQLAVGDVFIIHVLDRVLTYQIDQIEIVEPHEVDGIGIVSGQDYATLVTCTPYGINTHRLLVRGVRIENPPEGLAQAGGTTAGRPAHRADRYIMVSIGTAVALVSVLLVLVCIHCAKKWSGTHRKKKRYRL